MKTFSSINPFTSELIETFKLFDDDHISNVLLKSEHTFKHWRDVSVDHKANLITNVAQLLADNKHNYAQYITTEMGKPVTESLAEIEKCQWLCEYYADHSKHFLRNVTINTDAYKSYVSHEPLGSILAVMPWNFPFWQVLRCAVPALMAGNVVLLKHANNVLRCAHEIEALFQAGGFPTGAFQSLIIDHQQTQSVIKNPIIKAITLTGSEKAGQAVAISAGSTIKKTVLELGGSNAFIVLADADIDHAVEVAVKARFLNSGQSCIAAKRFIIVHEVYEEFINKFTAEVKKLKMGDPMATHTSLGPMARIDLAQSLEEMLKLSVKQGAKILTGGQRNKAFFQATVVVDVDVSMPVMQQETFGPVAAVIKVKDQIEAFKIAQQTAYGLGVSIFSKDIDAIEPQLKYFNDGAIFVNDMVKSDPRLPFGGTGISGYGRELSKDGMMEFVNKKTIYINQ